jgi:beta-glucanase (GH16 family)
MNWGRPVATEDFAGAALDGAGWFTYDSPAATPPRSPAAVQVRDGELQLVGGFDSQGRDVSGGVAHRLNQKYGRWEVRFRQDRGAGYSPGVLLWPQSENWPDDGEIDIVEIPNGDRTKGYNFIHNGPHNSSRGNPMVADFSQWHTVAVDWLQDHVTYWLDGIAQWTVTPPPDPREQSLVPTTSPMHLALQNDQGCDGFIECRNAQTPSKVIMHVDWIKVYKPPA